MALGLSNDTYRFGLSGRRITVLPKLKYQLRIKVNPRWSLAGPCAQINKSLKNRKPISLIAVLQYNFNCTLSNFKLHKVSLSRLGPYCDEPHL
jgi:hypothetical protein